MTTRPMAHNIQKLVMALAIVGMTFFLLNIVVDNPYSHRLVRAGINEKVEEYTNLTLNFQALKVSILPLGIDLYGLNVATNADEESPLVSAGHVGLRVSLWSLIMGQPRLGVVETRDLTVTWPPPWNFSGFLKNPPPDDGGMTTWPPDLTLPVDEISLRNTRLYVEVPLAEQVPLVAKSFVLSIVGGDIDATIDSWTEIDAAIKLQQVNAAVGAASFIEDTALEAEISLDGYRAVTELLRIDGERFKLEGQAALDFVMPKPGQELEKLSLLLEGQMQGDLSLLGSFLDLPDTRGPIMGDIKIASSIPVESREEATFLVSGQAQVHDAYLSGFRLLDSAASFQLDDKGIRFPELEVLIGDTSYAKASGEIKFNDALDYSFKGSLRDLRLLDLLGALKAPLDSFDLSLSTPNLTIKGKGDPFVLTAEATVQADQMTLPLISRNLEAFPVSPACRLDFHLAVTSDLLDFNGTQGICYHPPKTREATMPVAGSTEPPRDAKNASPLQVGGQIFFDGPQEGLALRARSEALHAQLGEYFAQIPLAGRGLAAVDIKGPFDRVLIEMQANISGTRVMNMPLGRLSGTFSVDATDEKISWHEASIMPDAGGALTAPSGSLSLNEQLTLRTRLTANDVNPQAVAAVIETLSPGAGLKFGIKSLNAEIEGPLLFPGAYQGQIRGHLTQGSWFQPGSAGKTSQEETFFDNLQIRLQASPTGFLADHVVATLGDLRLNIQVRHKRAFPFSYAEASQSDDIWASLGLHPDDTWQAEFATIDDQDAIAAASAPPTLNGASKTPPPDVLAALPFIGDILSETGISGLISASGSLTGTTDSMQGAFKASLLRPVILGAELAPFTIQGFVNNSKLDLLVNHAGNSLQGRLSVDVLAKGLPYEWYFDFNRLDLRAFATDVFFADPRNYAYLTASWRMQGEFTDWWHSTGDLKIEDIRGRYVRDIGGQTRLFDLKQEQAVRLLFAQRNWHFEDEKDLFLTGQYLQMRLSLPDANPPEKLSLKVEGLLDLAIAKAFTNAVDTASGKLRISADVSGSVSEPKFGLEITDLKPNPFIASTWTPVTLGLADVRPALRNIKLRVLARNGRLVIDSFTADKGSGTVTATGGMNLSDSAVGESRIDVTFADATVTYQVPVVKSFESQLSGNISIAGNRAPFKVTGDVNIVRARSTSEVDVRDEIINALRRQSFTTGINSDEPLMEFELSVTADQSIQIANRNLQTTLSADLQIRGTDITPVVLGQAEVDKGKFTYKRDFQIVRGLVTFDDPVKPDPSLDILAMSEVESYRIYIAITGRASNPTVEFSADPPTRESGTPLSKLDILVLLSRGSLPEENFSLGQQTQGAATSEAINLVMGQFEEPVEKLFDLSGQNIVRNVYIDTYPSEQGNPVPRLNFPLDLGEKFDVVVRADQTSSEIATEYDVHDNIKFSLQRRWETENETDTKTQTLGGSDAKVNLKFRFSFE